MSLRLGVLFYEAGNTFIPSDIMNYRMPSGEKGKVSLSIGNWITIALFFGAQSVALLKVGVSMMTAQAVQEVKITNIEQKIVDVKDDITEIHQERVIQGSKIDQLAKGIEKLNDSIKSN